MVKDIETRRSQSFNQRHPTLFAKARDLSEEFGAHVAVVAFSPSGVPHAFGGPTADSVLRAYLPGPASPPPPGSPLPGRPRAEAVGEAAARVAWMRRQVEDTEALVAAESALHDAVARKIRVIQASAGKRNWWEVDANALVEEELPMFIRALEFFRAEVQGRVDPVASARQRQLP